MNINFTDPLFGNYRAKVVNNKDKEKFGRVQVYIPELMPELDSRSDGIWARPANNPIGGRNTEADTNDNYYSGSSMIPPKGSWIWIFFESGQINRPYYFGSLDLENTPVLPENQVGSNYEKKWTLYKSHEGRAVVISDDPDDARVEITGKKRQINTPPTGDINSVYTIDENMTTVLIDERSGKQKVLIRTYKGDFFHIDVDEQNLHAYFKNDIELKCDNKFKLTAQGDIDIKSLTGDIHVQADSGDIDIKVGGDMKQESTGISSIKAGTNVFVEAGGTMNHKATGNLNQDGATLVQQNGAASSAQSASNSIEANPKGERNT